MRRLVLIVRAEFLAEIPRLIEDPVETIADTVFRHRGDKHVFKLLDHKRHASAVLQSDPMVTVKGAANVNFAP